MYLFRNIIDKGLVCRKKSKKSFSYFAANSLQYKSLSEGFAFSYDGIDSTSRIYVKITDRTERNIMCKQ